MKNSWHLSPRKCDLCNLKNFQRFRLSEEDRERVTGLRKSTDEFFFNVEEWSLIRIEIYLFSSSYIRNKNDFQRISFHEVTWEN